MDEQPDVVEMFGDAMGYPPRVAVVLFDKGEVLYTSWQPDEKVMATFQSRQDNQMMGLEVLAVALGLSTFGQRLKGRTIRTWIDNAGGEGALRNGSTRADDHNLLVHAIWLLAARMNSALWVERVGTHTTTLQTSRQGKNTVC